MSKVLTHGSLFAGIGGFEVAAKEAGIKTLWNCEIEPYPRLVLSARFPEVKQYGDIRKLRGNEVEPVDCITFGSPCQSFSYAAGANRTGLDGASGLFYEAVRVIKEMRESTNNLYPRWIIMENVPGIYSSKSNGRSDFREVLNELIKIKDKTVNVPLPKDGKFLTAGAIVGDAGSTCGSYSLAWRTLCSSRFGTAQRRRRMFLVLDFAGECAAKILSEQEGERRNFTPSYLKGQNSSGDFTESTGSVMSFEPGSLVRLDKKPWTEQARTLRSHAGDNAQAVIIGSNSINSRTETEGDTVDLFVGTKPLVLAHRQHAAPVTENIVGSILSTDSKGTPCLFEPKAYSICSQNSNSMKSQNINSGIYEAETARTLDGNCSNPTANQGGTVIALQGSLLNRKDENGPGGIGFREDVGYTVNTVDKGGAVAYQKTVGALCASDWRGIRNQDIGEDKAVVEATGQTSCFGNNGYGKWNSEVAPIKASGGDHPGGENVVVEKCQSDSVQYAVRRLTPLECLRLQGFPDSHLDNIDIPNLPQGLPATAEQIEYWRSAFAELGKKKSDKQIEKWLRNPYSDSNAYKAIGNSLAVPCALFVMRGIHEHTVDTF